MIYFIHDAERNRVKIGYSEKPPARLRTIQTAHSAGLKLLGSIPGSVSGEKRLQRQYKRLWIRGEWFTATPELMADIKKLIAGHLEPFLELCAVEPGLMELYEEAQGYKEGVRFCANAVWYGYAGHEGRGLKARLVELVGWQRKPKDELSTMKAYDIAYRMIYEALPDCGPECVCQEVLSAFL